MIMQEYKIIIKADRLSKEEDLSQEIEQELRDLAQVLNAVIDVKKADRIGIRI